MKKLILLLLLSVLVVSCGEEVQNDVLTTPDPASAPPISDNVILPEESALPSPLPNAEAPAVTEPKITLDEAKKIAFDDAGVKEGDVTELETDVDREGSRRYYEIDFKSGGYEYEYEIDLESGKILKKEKERD